jgi:predicted Zn-dependent protease
LLFPKDGHFLDSIYPSPSVKMSDVKTKDLTTQDLHHLRAAEGWTELGDFVSACNELEEIAAEAMANPAVLSMRYSIYAKAKKWDMAWEIANGLTAMVPDDFATWINLAYATRRKTEGRVLHLLQH